MRLPRRQFLRLVGAAAAVPALSQRASALEYPTRPLRWIVGFSPGGGADTVSRIMAQWLSERLGQSVVIENKPGASTNISIQAAVGSPPDGYTLLYIAASATVNVTLFDNLPFNLVRDIAPVSGLIDFPLVRSSVLRFPPTPFRSSSPMPRRTPAGSAWPRSAPAPRPTWPASCSRP
jgi:tripartite-type tricarboxylate transporter receptor subunit TctC